MSKKETTLPKREKSKVFIGEKDGKKQYKYFYGKTKKEAIIKADAYKRELDKGMNLLADDTSFGYMMDTWLEMKENDVCDVRYQCYNYASKKFNHLRNKDIKRIRTADLQKTINEWSALNCNTGRPSSKSSLQEMKLSVIQIFQMAIDNRFLDYNPAQAIKLPKKEETPRRRALTTEEQQWILDTPHRAQSIAMTMLFSGLRRGEAIPLLWSDFSRENKSITVNKSASISGGGFNVTPHTKNGSDRVVYIPDVLYNHLCAKFKQATSIYIFPSPKGNMMTNQSFRCMWDSYLIDLNLKYATLPINAKRPKSKFDPKKFPLLIPRITPHWLRHTYATMLYHSGVDLMVAKEQLGHSNIETTLQIYTHLDDLHKTRAIGKLNDYLVSNN